MEKTTRVSVRISESDMEEIKANAEKINLTVSEYIRSKAVREMEQIRYDPEIRQAILEALSLLRQLGSCMCQLSNTPEQEEMFRQLYRRLCDAADALLSYLKKEGA